MSSNVELKARCADPDAVRSVCQAKGAESLGESQQTDTFLQTNKGRLKIRQDSVKGGSLIFYQRPASPLPKQCDYFMRPLSGEQRSLGAFLEQALGALGKVQKKRTVFLAEAVRINLDRVDDLGDFVEIEVDADLAGGQQQAQALAESWMKELGVAWSDLVPWSYVELLAMKASAASWRAKLKLCENPGRLFVLDGASCSGKTTITERLRNDPKLKLKYVPRYCTRELRPGEIDGEEYLFIDHQRFLEMAYNGGFIEYRDFEFGMSYGLGWSPCLTPVLAGENALAVMNLGNARHLKEILPEIVTVLIDVPEKTIKKRLLGRGINKPHEIEERLGNARLVAEYRPYYDHVLNNEDGRLKQVLAELGRIIKG